MDTSRFVRTVLVTVPSLRFRLPRSAARTLAELFELVTLTTRKRLPRLVFRYATVTRAFFDFAFFVT